MKRLFRWLRRWTDKRITETRIEIARAHPLSRILAGTPWAASWGRTLQRVAGSESSHRRIRFGSMAPSLAVFLPRNALEGAEDTAVG